MSSLNAGVWLKRLKNDYRDYVWRFEKDGICRIESNDTFSSYRIHINQPSYIVPQSEDSDPCLAHRHELILTLPREYPYVRPQLAFADAGKRLAHVNVFDNGNWCVGRWVEDPRLNTDSLFGVLDRCFMSMSFHRSQVNLDSMASSEWASWYRRNAESGIFPTFEPWWRNPQADGVIIY